VHAVATNFEIVVVERKNEQSPSKDRLISRATLFSHPFLKINRRRDYWDGLLIFQYTSKYRLLDIQEGTAF
jgi:hypothetical protein